MKKKTKIAVISTISLLIGIKVGMSIGLPQNKDVVFSKKLIDRAEATKNGVLKLPRFGKGSDEYVFLSKRSGGIIFDLLIGEDLIIGFKQGEKGTLFITCGGSDEICLCKDGSSIYTRKELIDKKLMTEARYQLRLLLNEVKLGRV